MIGDVKKVRTANPNYHVSEDNCSRDEDNNFGALVDRNAVCCAVRRGYTVQGWSWSGKAYSRADTIQAQSDRSRDITEELATQDHNYRSGNHGD